MIKKCALFLLFISHLTFPLLAQDSLSVKLSGYVKDINAFNQLLPQEKVYLHFDNTGYYLGETIWYKAYVFTAAQNRLSDVSKVLYVDLLNQDGFVVSSNKHKIEEGQSHGNFVITDTLYSGFYEVRAYTRYMLNFDNHAIFSRVFPVYEEPEYEGDYTSKIIREREKQELVTLEQKDAKKSPPIKLSFYPEGGSLVRGLKSKIAVKALNEEGQDLQLTGQIYRQSDKKAVSDFKTLHQGMGYFEFTPDGESWQAGITYGGKHYEIPLPKALAQGYVMAVNNMNPANLLLQIAGSPQAVNTRLGLLVSCRGTVYAFDEITVQDEPVSVKILKSSLPTGVNQITLLDEEGTIHAERLVFINHGDYGKEKLIINADKNEYKPFEAIELTLASTDETGQPLAAILSVSVRDAATEEETYNTDNVLTNLLLSSELKGFVENPAYYFLDNSSQRRHNLDLLMMTQGWRRYSICQMAGIEKFNLRYAPEKDISISGTIYTALDKFKERKVMPDAQVKAWALDDSISMSGEVTADKNGKFHFSIGDVTGEYFLGLQTNVLETKGRNKGKWLKKASNILLDRFNPPHPKAYSYYETNIPLEGYNEGEAVDDKMEGIAGMKGQQLEAVTVTGKRKKRKRIGSFPPAVIIDVADEMDLQIDLFNWQQDACVYHNHDREIYGSVSGIDLELLLNLMLPDSINIDEKEKNYLVTLPLDKFYRHMLTINGGKKVPEIQELAEAKRELEQSKNREWYTDIMKRAAEEKVEFLTEAIRTQNPVDPCVIHFAKSIKNRLGIPTLTKTDYIYDMPATTTNMFYMDYIDKIMIYTDKSVRDINIYEKPHESWIADIAIRYVPYEEKDYRRPRIEGIRATKLHGYSQEKEFYSPDYSNNKLPEEPDFRRTLYWNPDVRTNKNGKVAVSFYNNGTCRRMTVSAEGLTAEGMPVAGSIKEKSN